MILKSYARIDDGLINAVSNFDPQTRFTANERNDFHNSNTLLKSLLSFFRIPNLLLIGALMWIIRQFVLAPVFVIHQVSFTLSWFQYSLYVVDLCLVTLIGYWINDWMDRDIDQINRPNRFLAKYKIPTYTFFFSWSSLIFFGLGITLWLALTTSKISLIWLYPVSIFLLFIYASQLKKKGFYGNLLVSFLLALLPWMAILPDIDSIHFMINSKSQGMEKILLELILFSLLIFVSNLGREIAKDAEDQIGDAVFGSKSIPIIKGIDFTKRTIIVLWIFLILIQLTLVFFVPFNPYVLVSALGIIALTFNSILKTNKAVTPIDYRKISTHQKIVMAIGLFQMIFLSL